MRSSPHVYDVLHASSDSLIQACFPEREEVQSKKETVANKYLSQLVRTRRPFLNFSEPQARVDGVNATRRHRDAVDAAARSYRRVPPFTTRAGVTHGHSAESSTRFVRCIKTNSEKQPQKLDKPAVLSQLVCSGVMAALEVSRAGFPTRVPYREFRQGV